MKRRQKWLVRLGESEWRRHTYGRDPSDNIRLIGSVSRGAQIGALGITERGEFVQVVGDHTTLLNQSQISRLVPASTLRQRLQATTESTKPATVPVVTIKRRRVLLPA